jgi:hypothetical protein
MEIPDSFDEADIFPQTVAGKIDLMVMIGKELIAKADEILRLFDCSLPLGVPNNLTERQIKFLGAYTMKLASIVQLQTECIEQMWNELKPPTQETP